MELEDYTFEFECFYKNFADVVAFNDFDHLKEYDNIYNEL
jgi:hypothetical protein